MKCRLVLLFSEENCTLVSAFNILLFPNLIYTLDNKLKLLKPFAFFHDNVLNCSKLESSVM